MFIVRQEMRDFFIGRSQRRGFFIEALPLIPFNEGAVPETLLHVRLLTCGLPLPNGCRLVAKRLQSDCKAIAALLQPFCSVTASIDAA